jgi:MFS family permease
MVVLDGTVVNIALPDAQRALGFTNGDRQWIITGYALAFGSLLLLGGKLADLFGRKLTFVTGLIGFAAASAVGGAATGFPMLVSARVCQGVFGALLAPAGLSLLTTTFLYINLIFAAIGTAGGLWLLAAAGPRYGHDWTRPVPWPSALGCSASCTASLTPRAIPGARRPLGASWPRVPR